MAKTKVVVEEPTENTASILDLPAEVISQICSYSGVSLIDILNLAVSHRKLNASLFLEKNSALWKTKYRQKYDDWDQDEFEIVITEHNSWKDELKDRICLKKTVASEIIQMPLKYMKYKNVPYHMFPFNEELHLNNQSRQHYVYCATVDFCKFLKIDSSSERNVDIVYMADQFLIYVSQVYFGYKIKNFLNLPLSEQLFERGFYLVGRWWYPTDILTYNDIVGDLDTNSLILCDILFTQFRKHPMFKNGYKFGLVVKNRTSKLDHDLYDEENTKIILKCMGEFLFRDRDMVCPCDDNIYCYLLRQVLGCHKGSVFILCVLYKSIALRLGVKVNITATSSHNFVSWTPSWPGDKRTNKPCYIIDIANDGKMRKARVCPVSKKLPGHGDGNSISELFWTFSKTVERLAVDNLDKYKYVLDFQKLLRPDDTEVESNYKRFHQRYEYCPCPLYRTSLTPMAPKHLDEKFNFFPNWEDIFPSVPKIRPSIDHPKYFVGKYVYAQCTKPPNSKMTKEGIIVGWTIMPSRRVKPKPVLYYMLIRHSSSSNSKIPVIEAILDSDYSLSSGECSGQMRDYDFRYYGKLFKRYNEEFEIYTPILDLAKCYPRDCDPSTVTE